MENDNKLLKEINERLQLLEKDNQDIKNELFPPLPPPQPNNCFIGDSLISTPKGKKPIKCINLNEEVIITDNKNAKMIGKVKKIIEPTEEEIVDVYFDNGLKWSTTKSQWFYGIDNEFHSIWDSNCAKAMTENGETNIKKIISTGHKEKVYDIVVTGINVFFINGIAQIPIILLQKVGV